MRKCTHVPRRAHKNVDTRTRRTGAARVLSPDVHVGPLGLRSLRVRYAFAIHGSACFHSPLEHTGSP